MAIPAYLHRQIAARFEAEARGDDIDENKDRFRGSEKANKMMQAYQRSADAITIVERERAGCSTPYFYSPTRLFPPKRSFLCEYEPATMPASKSIKERVIVSHRISGNCDHMTQDILQRIIYEELVPACEDTGVLLSYAGNHRGQDSLISEAIYRRDKMEKRLFDIASIQMILSQLDTIVTDHTEYEVDCYKLEQIVGDQVGKKVSTGDVIAAMLMKGFSASFGKINESMTMRCEFQARYVMQEGGAITMEEPSPKSVFVKSGGFHKVLKKPEIGPDGIKRRSYQIKDDQIGKVVGALEKAVLAEKSIPKRSTSSRTRCASSGLAIASRKGTGAGATNPTFNNDDGPAAGSTIGKAKFRNQNINNYLAGSSTAKGSAATSRKRKSDSEENRVNPKRRNNKR